MFNSRQGIEIQQKIVKAKEDAALDIWLFEQFKDLPPFDAWHGHPPKQELNPECKSWWPGTPESVGPSLKWDGDKIE